MFIGAGQWDMLFWFRRVPSRVAKRAKIMSDCAESITTKQTRRFQMKKKVERKEDGRTLIYYTFSPPDAGSKAENESDSEVE